MADPRAARARAHSNIALIKYWGKREASLNLPAVGSLSITLDALFTDTHVHFDPALAQDRLALNDAAEQVAPDRFVQFLDEVRRRAGLSTRARIHTRNNFPTAAGLASSASGFAALALAASHAAGLALSLRELSVLARQGSGSAARSIFGGFVHMHRGDRDDGLDAFAEPVDPPQPWPLQMAIGIVDTAAKKTGSTDGMRDSAGRAPYYSAWVESASTDLTHALAAVAQRDFTRLGELTEHSCLKMHGLMLATPPGLIYWQPATLAALHAVRELRGQGTEAYCTIDAGPQIKVLHRAGDTAAVQACLDSVPGVREVRLSGLGPAARLLD
ncbi:MAG: diphosphomevalonate decarboxylase [Salinisphaeraceae bacterium]|nr:diphosphomevalonate decarboxylase [Salinisphaeraceae bacterium]